MAWEQSPLTRTIAASRGDDNRDDPQQNAHSHAPTVDSNQRRRQPGENAQRYRCAKNPKENRSSLTGSFRNGPIAEHVALPLASFSITLEPMRCAMPDFG